MRGPFPVASRRSMGLPASRATRDPQPKTEFFVHYTADKGRVKWLLRGIRSRIRGYYNFHTKANGWSDIGYHAMLFQPWWRLKPVIVLCRPLNTIPAAQYNHNSGTIALCVVGREGEAFLRRSDDAIVWFINSYLPSRGYRSIKAVGGHRDVVNTSCPGSKIYARVDDIARRTRKRRVR